MIGQTISHYKILQKLGGGGMGVVYLADNLKLKSKVALKFLPPHLASVEEAKERFVQEAQAASALNHPNICTIHDIDETADGQLFIAMAYYEGQTLKTMLERGALSPEMATEIVRQIASGLGAAHEKGIIHRDIKPANIFVTDRGRAVILDFGLAKLIGTVDLTRTGSTVGTASYMSPEQIRGDDVDHRTDFWSLGAVLYEMLSGRRPFEGDYEQAVTYAVVNEEPVPLDNLVPEVPAPVSLLVSTLLAKEPSKRPDFAGEIIRDLQDLQDLPGRQAGIPGMPTRPDTSNRFRRRRAFFMTFGVTALLAAAILLWQFTRERPSNLAGGGSTPTIAVLPFSIVGDPSLADLSQGMVTLLSTRLDGFEGLNSLDPNVVLSHVSDDSRHTIQQGITLAQRFGASGFILGSVIRAGNSLQMNASLYEPDGSLASEAQVVFNGDSLLMKNVDRLSMQLLSERLKGQGEEVKSLAALSTHSYPALQAFMEGEAAMRGLDVSGAVYAFSRAVELDSTFALAWYRLAGAHEWEMPPAMPEARHALDQARRYQARLPIHIKYLVDADWFLQHTKPEEARLSAQKALSEQPSLARAWNILGEIQYHFGPFEGGTAVEARPYFEKALELQPGLGTEGKLHLVHIAMEERDFARAESLASQTTGPFALNMSRALSMATADGDSERMVVAEEMNQDLKPEDVSQIQATLIGLYLPTVAAILQDARSQAVDRDADLAAAINTVIDIESGRIRPYLTDSGAVAMRSSIYFLAYYPLERSELLEIQDLASSTIRGDGVPRDLQTAYQQFTIGLVDWRLQDYEAVDRQASLFAATADSSALAELDHSLGLTLSALAAWGRGDADEAISRLEESRFMPPLDYASGLFQQLPMRFFEGELLRSVHRIREAMPWYRSVWTGYQTSFGLVGPSLFRLAQCYDELGEVDEAIDYYSRFVDLWRDADPRLQPWVQEARASLDRLLIEKAREPQEGR